MRIRHLTPADYRVMPWANGRGQTVELLRIEGEAGALRLRLSVADVVEAGAFSRLPGIDRVLTLIEGVGFDLDFGDAAPSVSALPFAPIAFSGDWETRADKLQGPSRDFNVMTARGGYDVDVRRLAEGRSVFSGTSAGETVCLYVVRGTVTINGIALVAQADALLVIDDAGRLDLNAAGDVLAIRLMPRSI